MINTNSNFLNVQPSNYEGFWTPYANTKQTSQNWQHCSVLKTEIWFQNAICKCYQEIVSDSSILVSSSSVSFTEKMQFLGLMSSSFFVPSVCSLFFLFLETCTKMLLKVWIAFPWRWRDFYQFAIYQVNITHFIIQ